MIMKIASPVMVFIGIIGNLANFYAFTRTSMMQYSTFRFLAYLSISDILVLLIGKSHIIFMSFSSHDFRDDSDIICSLHSFLTIFSTHLSTNLLAAVSVDRVFSMNKIKQNRKIQLSFMKKSKKPKVGDTKSIHKSKNGNNTHHRNSIARFSISTSRSICHSITHTEIMLIVIIVIVFLVNSHFLLFMRLTTPPHSDTNSTDAPSSTEKQCYPSMNEQNTYFTFYTLVWPWIDLFFYCYMPFTIMIICTGSIIYRLVKMNNSMHRAPNAVGKSSSCVEEITAFVGDILGKNTGQKRTKLNNEIAKRRARKSQQVYKLLLSLNILFFVMVTPVVTLNSFGLLSNSSGTLTAIVYLMAYSNHTFTFIFYGLTCKQYRDIFLKFFRKHHAKLSTIDQQQRLITRPPEVVELKTPQTEVKVNGQ